jgi:hypothetical protein
LVSRLAGPLEPHQAIARTPAQGRDKIALIFEAAASWHRADRVLHRGPGKSAAKWFLVNDFTGLLVLRGSGGKSARFSCPLNTLPRLPVLRGAEEDSAEMAEKIGAHDAEFVLR